MNQVMVSKTRDYLIVKIPLRTVEQRRAADISPRAISVIDQAIEEGLGDIKAGRVLGPFSSVKNFRAHLRKTR